jgi:hypothetical protein
MPGQAVLGKVVVAGLADIDVGEQAQADRRVERSGRDADGVSFGGIPEEARSALAAEPAPGLLSLSRLSIQRRPPLSSSTRPSCRTAVAARTYPLQRRHSMQSQSTTSRTPQLVADRPPETTSRCSRAVTHWRSHRSAPTGRDPSRTRTPRRCRSRSGLRRPRKPRRGRREGLKPTRCATLRW